MKYQFILIEQKEKARDINSEKKEVIEKRYKQDPTN